MKIFFSLLPLLLLANNSSAQWYGNFDSVKIVPANPTDQDTIRFIGFETFPSGGCDLDNFNISVIGSNVEIDLAHCLGMLTVICKDTDSISFGPIPIGTYILTCRLSIGGSPPCDSQAPIDTSQISFTVLGSNKVDDPFLNQTGIRIYYDSYNEEIRTEFSGKSGWFELKLSDLTGSVIRKEILRRNNNAASLVIPKGIYIWDGLDEFGNRGFGKLLVY